MGVELWVGVSATAGAILLLFLLLRTQDAVVRAVGVAGIAGLAAWVGVSAADGQGRAVDASVLPKPHHDDGYISSDVCRGCHLGNHASWYATYHRTMTQVASPETVLAPFDGRTLEDRGAAYVVERRGEQFWVRQIPPANPDSARPFSEPLALETQIVMLTGSHHLQAYWYSGGKGQLKKFPWNYRVATNRWIPSFDSFLVAPDPNYDPQQGGSIWNANCSMCHATRTKPYVKATGPNQVESAYTETVELGIACEACHGPGQRHVSANQNVWRRYTQHLFEDGDDTIVNPAKLDHVRSSEVCGQCHTLLFFPTPRANFHGHRFKPGDVLSDHMLDSVLMELFRRMEAGEEQENFQIVSGFWPDQTVRIAGREYLGQLRSKCYTDGEMSCLSCHSMHDSDPNRMMSKDKVGDEGCVQCHTAIGKKIEDHTHHPAGTDGSRCYNCHMPYTSYGLLGATRSHRVDSPTPSGADTRARPNACNLCHLDKTLNWTAEHLTRWYQQPSASLGEEHRSVAAGVLWTLRGDAAQRAVTAWSMTWGPAREAAGTDWQGPVIAELLVDDYAAIRSIAADGLATLPAFKAIEYDYVAAPKERERAAAEVLEIWRKGHDGPARPDILSMDKGAWDERAARALLDRRDNRPIGIAE
jgi:predicted CXXCH cytochrome family protein